MMGGSLGQPGQLARARELPPGAPIGAPVPCHIVPALGFLIFLMREACLVLPLQPNPLHKLIEKSF